jgi:hypothetical protein
MKSSPEGLVPARGFLEAGMKPRPSFNDGSNPGKMVLNMFKSFEAVWRFDRMMGRICGSLQAFSRWETRSIEGLCGFPNANSASNFRV